MSGPAWSPDGSKILVLVNEEAYLGIQVIAAHGGDLARVPINRPGAESIEHAAWSPDGKRIAMVGEFGGQSGTGAGHIALLTIGADGADLRLLVGRRKCALNTSACATVQELTAKRLALNPELQLTAHCYQTYKPIWPHGLLGYRLSGPQATRHAETIPALARLARK